MRDHDRTTDGSFMGCIDVDFSNVDIHVSGDLWLQLEGRKGKKDKHVTGSIHIKVVKLGGVINN